jgi:hypothetical protein
MHRPQPSYVGDHSTSRNMSTTKKQKRQDAEEDLDDNLYVTDEMDPLTTLGNLLKIAARSKEENAAASRPSLLSREQQLAQLDKEMQSISHMRETLLDLVETLHDDLLNERLEKTHSLLDSYSPLLSLNQVGVLDRVISYLDEEALYQLEEASEAVKTWIPEHQAIIEEQWEILASLRTTGAYSLPDGRLTSFEKEMKGRVFGETSAYTARMEKIACQLYDYDRTPTGCEVALLKPSRRAEERLPIFSLDRYCDKNYFFIRLSLQEQSGLRLLWHGFVRQENRDRKYPSSSCFDFSLCDAARQMEWPELREYQQWARSLTREEPGSWFPPIFNKESNRRQEYEGHMATLLARLRITICNYRPAGHVRFRYECDDDEDDDDDDDEDDDDDDDYGGGDEPELLALVLATGGHVKTLIDGWCHLHARDANGRAAQQYGNPYATTLKGMKIEAMVRIGQDGLFDLRTRACRVN